MPHALSELQKEYLQFIRNYVRDNEYSPRLEEIADAFQVRSPTAHKILRGLQSKGYLYFGRDPKSGFFIRLIERAGCTEMVMEVLTIGKVAKLGEVVDFPEEIGHFASVFVGTKPESVFALAIKADIPQAGMLAGDLLIFDKDKKPQPGDICIGPIGKRLFLIRVAGKMYDREYESYKAAIYYPIPNDLTDPEAKQWLNWHPLAYDEDTHDFFTQVAEEEKWKIGPLPPDFIFATALRLTRQLAW